MKNSGERDCEGHVAEQVSVMAGSGAPKEGRWKELTLTRCSPCGRQVDTAQMISSELELCELN